MKLRRDAVLRLRIGREVPRSTFLNESKENRFSTNETEKFSENRNWNSIDGNFPSPRRSAGFLPESCRSIGGVSLGTFRRCRVFLYDKI